MRHAAAPSLCQILGFCAVGAVFCAAQTSKHLATPLRPYTLRLESFVPAPGRAMGVLLKARINNGRTLRLILDSGAEHIVVTRATARAVGLATGSRLSLVGFGRMEENAGTSIARTVDVGPLSFRECPVDVVDHKVVDGADGVLPLVLFSDFIVRLDFPAKTLDLTPYQSAGESHGRFTRALAVNAVLFLRTALDELHNGYFLLDTGAAHNALSRTTAKALGGPGVLASSRVVQGASGVAEVLEMKSAVRFRTAGQDITSDDVVLLDLDTMSRYNGLEVAGLLGYPALKRYVVTVNYRDSLVRMEAGTMSPQWVQ
jgi:Aspartyl protease